MHAAADPSCARRNKARPVLVLFTLANLQLQPACEPALRFGGWVSLGQIAGCSRGQRPTAPRRAASTARTNSAKLGGWLALNLRWELIEALSCLGYPWTMEVSKVICFKMVSGGGGGEAQQIVIKSYE